MFFPIERPCVGAARNGTKPDGTGQTSLSHECMAPIFSCQTFFTQIRSSSGAACLKREVRECFANGESSGTIVKIGPHKGHRKPGTPMKRLSRQHLPLAPLLHAYTRAGVPSLGELHQLPGLGPRCAAILSATAKFLFP